MNTKIIDFYEKGNSRKKTCNKFNITDKKLINILKENNIHIRNHGEQTIIENIKRANPINHFYFSELNYFNSYYLGFFGADATVRKNRNEIKIGLSSVDIKFLEELKDNLKSENNIHIRQTSNGFECADFCFSSAQIKKDIAKYGIVPNKTYIGLKLDLIPEKYKLSFIKGFFDGDGCFSYNKISKQCCLSFCSHTIDILNDIKEYFGSGSIYKDKRTGAYTLSFSTVSSIAIMNNFYALDTPCLNRKKEKFYEYLKLRNKNPRDKSSF